jgi:hypothetical protein
MDHAHAALLRPVDVNVPEPTDGAPPWESAGWLAEADEWISASCEAAGLTRQGPGEIRGRMYSIVARIPVEGGCVWFKENPPRSGFEPAVVDALTRWSPDDAPPVIAVDRERRWALTHDVGQRLDGLLKRDPDIRNMHTPLRRYARLQRKLVAHVDELLGIGVPDGRPEHIEELLDSVLTHAPSGFIGDDVLRHVAAKLPELREWAEELAAFGVPSTIDHQDLHPGNILGTAADARPFDWGDSVVGSPFGSILVVLRATPEFCGFSRDDPGVRALREIYLEPWSEEDGRSVAEVERAVDLALRLTPVMRAHTWTRTFPCFLRAPKPWGNVEFWLGGIGCDDPVTVGL